MTWNYRIIKHDDGDPIYYGLHEVYYDEEHNIDMWTLEAEVVGDSVEEIVSVLKMMLDDVKRHDLLTHSELPKK
jgi:uncharacterized protein with NAD-binding domain and iron-sulfur cluster